MASAVTPAAMTGVTIARTLDEGRVAAVIAPSPPERVRYSVILRARAQPYCPSSAASATRSTIRTIRRGFHSSIAVPPEQGDARHLVVSAAGHWSEITRWGDRGVSIDCPPKGIGIPIRKDRPLRAAAGPTRTRSDTSP